MVATEVAYRMVTNKQTWPGKMLAMKRMAVTSTLVFDGAWRLPLTATTLRGRLRVFSTMLRRYAGRRVRCQTGETRRNPELRRRG